ncbi:AI-2E family transporter [Candidatus Saccharibacteria bacterium]|nr:AI-2E family transporter [Candidatus Saccharibacteria bacterium]
MSRTIQVDTKTFVRFWLVIFALAVVWFLIVQAHEALIIIGISIFLAVAIKPLANKIDQIDKRKKRPGLTAAVSVFGVVLIIGTIIAAVGPVVINETSHFVSQVPEQVQNSVGGWDKINEIGSFFGVTDAKTQIVAMVKNTTSSILGSFPQTLMTSVSTISGILTGTILVIVLTILFLTQGPGVVDSVMKRIYSKNSKRGEVAKELVEKVTGVISKYVTGQVLVAVLDGVVAGLAVLALSLIFGFSSGLAIPMAMIAMTLYLIPMFGPVISCALITLLILFSSPWAALCYLVFYVVYSQIENNVISPKIQGNSLNLPSLVILVSVVIGMYAFGLIGAIISIPIAGCIKVFIDEYPKIKAAREE